MKDKYAKYCFLDFEFNQSSNRDPNLVCCSLDVSHKHYDFWLFREDETKEKLKVFLTQLIEQKYIFVSYAVAAEARCFLALGIDPTKAIWIDLYLEYKQLQNKWNTYLYGKQLLNDKKVFLKPPVNQWGVKEVKTKGEANLVAAAYKLLGVKIDSKRKRTVRDMIISSPLYFEPKEKKEIMEYCRDDIKYLKQMLIKIETALRKVLGREYNNLHSDMFVRGEFAARTAKIEQLGYPINHSAVENFSNSVKFIIQEIQEDINKQFPDIKPFQWMKQKRTFVQKYDRLKEWLLTTDLVKHWPTTDSGKYSMALETFTKHFDFKHDYPRGNFGAQMVRFLKTKQSLNGFMPITSNSKRKSFWESVGHDERVRPYLGIYGSQTSRNQPPSTGFIPLKAAWMRALIQAPKERAIAGIDYKSQEFLIAALLSEDKRMIKAYESGDVYLWFAKEAEAIPKDGLRKDYEKERDLFKATTLAVSYSMTAMGLARKLTSDRGKIVSEDDAQDLIDMFYDVFEDYKEYKEDILDEYGLECKLRLPCGWHMFGDNSNHRSVTNFPVQGMGASIMRKAVALAQDNGLDVIYTLHDALYIEYDAYDFEKIRVLATCMKEAFRYYFPDSMKRFANVGLDCYTWSQEYWDFDEVIKYKDLKLEVSEIFIDPRSKSEYERFKKYF